MDDAPIQAGMTETSHGDRPKPAENEFPHTESFYIETAKQLENRNENAAAMVSRNSR